MLKLMTIAGGITLMGLVACSPKSVTETPAVPELSDKELTMEGFVKGSIKEFSELKGNCQYQMDLEGIGMAESLEMHAEFKKYGMAIRVKYSLQRRHNTCGDSQPVHIVDIKKREG